MPPQGQLPGTAQEHPSGRRQAGKAPEAATRTQTRLGNGLREGSRPSPPASPRQSPHGRQRCRSPADPPQCPRTASSVAGSPSVSPHGRQRCRSPSLPAPGPAPGAPGRVYLAAMLAPPEHPARGLGGAAQPISGRVGRHGSGAGQGWGGPAGRPWRPWPAALSGERVLDSELDSQNHLGWKRAQLTAQRPVSASHDTGCCMQSFLEHLQGR